MAPDREEVIASVPPQPEDRLYPKERALLELVQQERRLGRRVLVYIKHTQSRDISPSLERVLGEAGLRVATLKAGTVATDPPRGVDRAGGQRGRRRPARPPTACANGVGPRRLPDDLLVRGRVLRLHNAPGEPSLVAHRPEPSSAGRLLRVSGDAVGAGARVGGEEAPGLARRRGRAGRGGSRRARRRGRRPAARTGALALGQCHASEESLEGLFAEVRQAAGDAEAALHPDELAPEEPEPAAGPRSGAATTPVDPRGHRHTHRGEFRGVPPIGERVDLRVIVLGRIEGAADRRGMGHAELGVTRGRPNQTLAHPGAVEGRARDRYGAGSILATARALMRETRLRSRRRWVRGFSRAM